MYQCRIKKAENLGENQVIIELEPRGVLHSIEDAKSYVNVLERLLNRCIGLLKLSLHKFEIIGQRYILYKYDIVGEHGECRVIADKKTEGKIIYTACILRTETTIEVDQDVNKKQGTSIMLRKAPRGLVNKLPEGQKLIPKPVVYAINGPPSVDLKEWRLIVDGLVNYPLRLSHSELLSFPQVKVKAMFHCVTGWSIREQVWEGIELLKIARKARVKEDAKWVFVESLDGYTTIIPLEDFLHPQSLLVLRVNGSLLSLEQGVPARIFIPHLYGWKHAKWIKRITFRKDYVDGYWETLGYHERGNVLLEERFKNSGY